MSGWDQYGHTPRVLGEVYNERDEQDKKWGEQNHPMSPEGLDATEEAAECADFWKVINDLRQKNGQLSWDGILLEEVYEALSEDDPKKIRAELIQVAAVAVAMVECLDRAIEHHANRALPQA